VSSCAVIHSAVTVPITEHEATITIIYGDQSFETPVDMIYDSVDKVKNIAKEKFGVTAAQSRLIFDNEHMRPHLDLYNYGVHKIRNPVLFLARMTDKMMYTGNLGETGSVNLGELLIVQGETTFRLRQNVNASTTIGEMKDIISQMNGWDAKDIVIECNGFNLNDDSQTLESVDIRKQQPVLFISKRNGIPSNNKDGFEITAQFGEVSYAIMVESDATVRTFRDLVEQSTGLSNIDLTFKSEKLHDDLSLNDYGIYPDNDHVVFMSKKIE